MSEAEHTGHGTGNGTGRLSRGWTSHLGRFYHRRNPLRASAQGDDFISGPKAELKWILHEIGPWDHEFDARGVKALTILSCIIGRTVNACVRLSTCRHDHQGSETQPRQV